MRPFLQFAVVALIVCSSTLISAYADPSQRSSGQNMYQGTEKPPIPALAQFNFDGSKCTTYQKKKIIASWQHAGRILPTSREISYFRDDNAFEIWFGENNGKCFYSFIYF